MWDSRGPVANAEALIKSGKLVSYFGERARPSSARPLSFQINQVGNPTTARFSDTAEYEMRECQVPPPEPDCPRILYAEPRDSQWFNKDRRVRVEEALVRINDDCSSANVEFLAAAMVDARFRSSDAPWVEIVFYDDNGNPLTNWKPFALATVTGCGGYEQHDEPLNDKFPKEVLERAARFDLRMLGTSNAWWC